jgi:hypothetical protein
VLELAGNGRSRGDLGAMFEIDIRVVEPPDGDA